MNNYSISIKIHMEFIVKNMKEHLLDYVIYVILYL